MKIRYLTKDRLLKILLWGKEWEFGTSPSSRVWIEWILKKYIILKWKLPAKDNSFILQTLNHLQKEHSGEAIVSYGSVAIEF